MLRIKAFGALLCLAATPIFADPVTGAMDQIRAVAILPTDLEGLVAVYQPLLDDCAACHEAYRIKSN